MGQSPRDLIRRMSREDPLRGARRIHGELLMLGVNEAQLTASKYLVQGRVPPPQCWKTFLRNHAQVLGTTHMGVVPTLTFERLFAFLIAGHGRRQLLWFWVTRHPTAEWLARQITKAFPWSLAVCTGNFICVDEVKQSPKRRNERAAMLIPCFLGRTIQIEESA
jgi:hypothetical protein